MSLQPQLPDFSPSGVLPTSSDIPYFSGNLSADGENNTAQTSTDRKEESSQTSKQEELWKNFQKYSSVAIKTFRKYPECLGVFVGIFVDRHAGILPGLCFGIATAVAMKHFFGQPSPQIDLPLIKEKLLRMAKQERCILFQDEQTNPITAFLANSYERPFSFVFQGKAYPVLCAEAAFQLAKLLYSSDPRKNEKIAMLLNDCDADSAIAIGEKIQMTTQENKAWNNGEKYRAMKQVLDNKFDDLQLKELLLATGSSLLKDLNTRADEPYTDEILLGSFLMAKRREIVERDPFGSAKLAFPERYDFLRASLTQSTSASLTQQFPTRVFG